MATAPALTSTTLEGTILEAATQLQLLEQNPNANGQAAERINITYDTNEKNFTISFTSEFKMEIDAATGKPVLTAKEYLTDV